MTHIGISISWPLSGNKINEEEKSDGHKDSECANELLYPATHRLFFFFGRNSCLDKSFSSSGESLGTAKHKLLMKAEKIEESAEIDFYPR